ncbi:hypothetical protein BCR44DRAFT_1294174 [Catenaria anguillulae PL171]|uniref:Bacterial extracellular solute-binding protein n=1 Tax=Catenaria anguillulae PL171 TaxID=765915 RepID=A0A1Y2HV38_9FUNG|nr:hypothetical protein BCR44DRAFT_1294174 [Catenaria anguillulae PL171]
MLESLSACRRSHRPSGTTAIVPSRSPLISWMLLIYLLSVVWQVAHALTTVRVLVPAAFNQDNWATQRNLTTAFAARTGIQVEFVTMATAITDYTATAVNTMFYSKDAFVDILALDVVWIGDYGEYLLPLDGDAGLAAVLAQHNPQNVAAGMYGGQLKAVPQNADYGVLYSRMDLLNRYGYSAPPTTYQEMEEMMAKIVPEEKKTNPSFIGISNQVSAYEGLTCNVLEWAYAEDAGVLLEPDRTLSSFNQQSTVGQRVVSIGKRMRKWFANGWMSIGLTESSSGREWIRGNTLFHRNWPYMSVYTRDSGVTWPWRLTKLPAGGAALGGWLWGANKYTRNPDATKRVLELFASIEWQKSRAVFEGAPPTIPALYSGVQCIADLRGCPRAQDCSPAVVRLWSQVSRGVQSHLYPLV